MKIGEIDGPFSPEQVLAYEREVEDWFSSFPPAYSITEPDTSWDKEHPYIVLQRRQLHATAYMIKLGPLKPYITKIVNGITPEIDQAFQSIGVDCCLKLMEASQRIFDLIFPISAKFHLVIFCIFDTAAILCSALIHDKARSLPQRHQVVKAIETALTMLEQFSLITNTGAMSYKIISTLVAGLPLSSQERQVLSSIPPLRQPEHPNQPLPETMVASDSFSDSTSSNTNMTTFPSTEITEPAAYTYTPTVGNWHFPQDPTFQSTSLSDLDGIDFGELSQVWDWENLNLDAA
jgi:hypothetical protein